MHSSIVKLEGALLAVIFVVLVSGWNRSNAPPPTPNGAGDSLLRLYMLLRVLVKVVQSSSRQ